MQSTVGPKVDQLGTLANDPINQFVKLFRIVNAEPRSGRIREKERAIRAERVGDILQHKTPKLRLDHGLIEVRDQHLKLAGVRQTSRRSHFCTIGRLGYRSTVIDRIALGARFVGCEPINLAHAALNAGGLFLARPERVHGNTAV